VCVLFGLYYCIFHLFLNLLLNKKISLFFNLTIIFLCNLNPIFHSTLTFHLNSSNSRHKNSKYYGKSSDLKLINATFLSNLLKLFLYHLLNLNKAQKMILISILLPQKYHLYSLKPHHILKIHLKSPIKSSKNSYSAPLRKNLSKNSESNSPTNIPPLSINHSTPINL
jgi:hypothetical protein